MQIQIDRTIPGPLYRKIAQQIQTMIFDGRLVSGSRLPAVRSLARQLQVSIPTALRAYATLRDAGLICGAVGSGTYVSEPRKRWAAVQVLRGIRDKGPINQYEQVSTVSGIRSMATAAADPQLFQGDELVAEMIELARNDPWSFYYAPAEGAGELIRQGAQLLSHHALHINESNIVIGPGAFPTVAMAIRGLAQPGDRILLDENAFLGAPGFFRHLDLQPVFVPSDAEGTMDLDMASRMFEEHRPQFLLVAHGYGLMTGHLLSEEKRAAIARMVEQNDIVLVEAANYARIFFEEEPGECISGRIFDTGRAIFLESLDYSMAPGLRTTFLAAAGPVLELLIGYMRAHDQGGSLFHQIALARLLARGGLRTHLQRALPRYRERRDSLLKGLQARMPAGVEWTRPKGGLSLWVTLSEDFRCEGLYEEALEHGVGIAPGWMFREPPVFDRSFRLSYGIAEPDTIHEAVRILGRLLDARRRRA